jgi:inner membrane protein
LGNLWQESQRPAEYWVLAVFVGLLVLALNFQEGDLKSSVSQLLGNSASVEEVLNTKGKDHLIYADITGTFVGDRSSADGKYLIVEQIGKEFLVQDDRGIFQTGKEIIVNRISANPDKRAVVKISQISFADESIAPKLYRLYELGNVYLTGELAIDLGEDLQVSKPLGKFHSIERTGNNLKLQSAPLDQVYSSLVNSFGSGELKVKSLEVLP